MGSIGSGSVCSQALPTPAHTAFFFVFYEFIAVVYKYRERSSSLGVFRLYSLAGDFYVDHYKL